MSKIDMLLGNYTFLGEQGNQAITRDILSAKKFRTQLADVFNSHQKSSSDDKLLRSLAKDYIAAKDKDSSKLIRTRGAKVTRKLLTGNSMKGSNLNTSGGGKEEIGLGLLELLDKSISLGMNGEGCCQL